MPSSPSSESPDDALEPAGSLLRRTLPDLGVWGASPGFTRLWLSGSVTGLGSVFTLVAVPLQIAQLTRSPLAVGAVGAVELVPTVVFALYGGAVADAFDRRRIVLLSEALLAVLSVVLLLDALLWSRAWPLFAVAGLVAAAQGLQRPSWEAAVPRLVPGPLIPAAASWTGLSAGATFVAGPVLGGLVVASAGPAWCYGIDLASFVLSLTLLTGLPPMRAGDDREDGEDQGGRVSLRGIGQALGYARRHRLLVGTYLTDLSVTVLAFPIPLYPFLAGQLHARWALGLLYASTGIGMLLASLSSGWVGRARRHGRIAVAASAGMGACLAAAGVSDRLWLVVALLVTGGAAHGIGDIARSTVWNRTIPDRMRGRLAGVELLIGAGGPAAGDLRAGLLGSRFGIGPAIWSGGLACLVAALVIASAPGLTERAD